MMIGKLKGFLGLTVVFAVFFQVFALPVAAQGIAKPGSISGDVVRIGVLADKKIAYGIRICNTCNKEEMKLNIMLGGILVLTGYVALVLVGTGTAARCLYLNVA